MTYKEMIKTTEEIESGYPNLKVLERSRSASWCNQHYIAWDYQNGKVKIAIDFVAAGGNITIDKIDITGEELTNALKLKLETFFREKYK